MCKNALALQACLLCLGFHSYSQALAFYDTTYFNIANEQNKVETATADPNAFTTSVGQTPVVSASPIEAGEVAVLSNVATIRVKNNGARNARVRFYGRKKQGGKKFTVIVLPDTQCYTGEYYGGTNEMFKSQTTWIANNINRRNIAYVGQLGDCTEHGDSLEVEWKRADTAVKTIEDTALTGLPEGLPYGICVGNHDQSPRGNVNGTTAFYNQYFGVSRFKGRSYYGGHFGANNNNHYQFFSAGGLDFLVISLEWNAIGSFASSGGALEWAEGLVQANATRKVIVMTHYMLNGNGTFSPQGKAIYDRLKSYPNVLLLLGGHVIANTGEATRSDSFNGHTVHTTLQDYQVRPNGGSGLLRIYEFDPAASQVSVQTYSPYTDTFETDANSQFTLNVDLKTDDAQAFRLIGESNNTLAGNTASVEWSLLQANTDYEWYAEIYDGQHTAAGPMRSFVTQPQTNTRINNNLGR